MPAGQPTLAPITAVPTFRPTISPTVQGMLPSFGPFAVSTNSALQNTVNVPIPVCSGDVITLSLCSAGVCRDPTSGDTFLRLLTDNGLTELAFNDGKQPAHS